VFQGGFGIQFGINQVLKNEKIDPESLFRSSFGKISVAFCPNSEGFRDLKSPESGLKAS